MLLLVMPALGQERSDAQPKKEIKIGPPLGRLDKAQGWSYDITEKKWVSGRNKIPFLMPGPDYALGKDNFKSFEFREMFNGDQKYYILIKTGTDGKFKYESIRKGFYSYPVYSYYVIKEECKEKLAYLENRKINFIFCELEEGGFGDGKVDFRKIRLACFNDDVWKKTTLRGKYLFIYLFPMKDKKLIQIYIKYTRSTSMIKREIKPEDREYYEISEAAFKKLFNIDYIEYYDDNPQ
jgi:hypothetical protein